MAGCQFKTPTLCPDPDTVLDILLLEVLGTPRMSATPLDSQPTHTLVELGSHLMLAFQPTLIFVNYAPVFEP